MFFVDFLEMYQDYPEGGLPVVGKKLFWSIDLETGEESQPNPSRLAFEGSYSSTLQIRCDGQRVTVGGNPSRWQRIDNLFGHATLEACVAVYNRILLELGLPPFSKCTKFDWCQSGENDRSRLWTDGAVITRIDWTRNLGVGRDNVLPFLRGLSTQALNRGKLPYLYPNGRTTDWNKGSSWRYDKIYDKGYDLASRKKLKKLKTDEERDYYKRLIDYCEEMGIAREEHTFKQKFLSRHNFCFYGMVRESDFEPYLNEIDNAMKRLEIAAVDYITIADQLLDREIVKSRQAANTTEGYALKWLHGHALEHNSQYYVHRGRLLQLGIDISLQFDGTKPVPQLKRDREIHVSTVLPPPWYRMPEVPTLKLVA
ncbi:MAG: hypothetical protein HYX62_06495 [Gammaproteobacteria bacterium]|nr:hypothetical protein [Gammaproteobacteria bacterium]